ncbi:hypothetical protein [Rhodopseudomonas pseudopalustris]|uniref:Uncharacterized protein n=1 Tax=Rhodopseudomonas pseudopalustris TaxID=1513892 RepID=A0A1H8V551_9BRAD|nr:hypothetical protein [Rhodopseudomonas pseudopalustris]SEP10546.1 hypothetical protein SAMN05444123_10852 [Rhodopseudomonas pseudopalustris]
MWSINEPSLRPWTTDPIVPDEILYEFNGPLTFTASFGPFDALFHHIGRRENSNFYAVVQSNEQTVEALQSGALSIRGALSCRTIWIVDLDLTFAVQRYWICDQDDFPEKLMPARNVPLYASMEQAPDSLEEANAYFSIAFRGERLANKSIPFNLLKSLIDDSYEAARRLLSPAFMAGAKSATFDFPARAIPGSLILALDEPRINDALLRRRTAESPLSVEDAQASFIEQRDLFFQETAELVAKANSGQLSDSLAEERFALLDNLQQIIPSDQNRIESVVFSAREGNSVLSVAVNERAGTTMHRAFKRIEKKAVTDVGRVEIVNSPSKTFVYRSSRGKQVTCYVSPEEFQTLEESGKLQIGALVRVKGHLAKRPQRDQMTSEGQPDITVPPRTSRG